MPQDYKITISDEGGKYLQAALDVQNDYQRRATLPEFTTESLLQWTIEQKFGISKDQVEGRARQEQIAAITSKMVALPTSSLPAIARVVDEESAKQ